MGSRDWCCTIAWHLGRSGAVAVVPYVTGSVHEVTGHSVRWNSLGTCRILWEIGLQLVLPQRAAAQVWGSDQNLTQNQTPPNRVHLQRSQRWLAEMIMLRATVYAGAFPSCPCSSAGPTLLLPSPLRAQFA